MRLPVVGCDPHTAERGMKNIYEFAYASMSKLAPKRHRSPLMGQRTTHHVDTVQMMDNASKVPALMVPKSAFANLIR
jgi:hypothetical protein